MEGLKGTVMVTKIAKRKEDGCSERRGGGHRKCKIKWAEIQGNGQYRWIIQ